MTQAYVSKPAFFSLDKADEAHMAYLLFVQQLMCQGIYTRAGYETSGAPNRNIWGHLWFKNDSIPYKQNELC